jgi:hypothetical protein
MVLEVNNLKKCEKWEKKQLQPAFRIYVTVDAQLIPGLRVILTTPFSPRYARDIGIWVGNQDLSGGFCENQI